MQLFVLTDEKSDVHKDSLDDEKKKVGCVRECNKRFLLTK